MVVAPTLDTVVSADTKKPTDSITAPKLDTAGPKELLVAYVSFDGPQAPTQQVKSLRSDDLTWTREARANQTWGSTEVWTAYATKRVRDVQVKAVFKHRGYTGTITVAAYAGAAPEVGVASATGISSEAKVVITPRSASSLIWSVGHNWSTSTAPRLPDGHDWVHKFHSRQVDDYFWVQRRTTHTTSTSALTLRNPGLRRNDRWQLVAVEIRPAGSG